MQSQTPIRTIDTHREEHHRARTLKRIKVTLPPQIDAQRDAVFKNTQTDMCKPLWLVPKCKGANREAEPCQHRHIATCDKTGMEKQQWRYAGRFHELDNIR